MTSSALTHRDFSHRKAWLVDRLRHLAAIFAIEVCAYAVMENHYHTILRTRPDIVATMVRSGSGNPLADTLPPTSRHSRRPNAACREAKSAPWPIVRNVSHNCADACRSLSWFMGRLNEFIARAANKEDGVKGRFWESRFKCQVLLDDAAIAACMVYVDLNPHPCRSGSHSGGKRLHQHPGTDPCLAERDDDDSLCSQETPAQDMPVWLFRRRHANAGKYRPKVPNAIPEGISALANSFDSAALSAGWLCPIQSDSERRGILQMTAAEYFDLVDKSGRMMRSDKRGAIDADLAPILLRIGANPEAWIDTISRFGSKFRLAAGLLSSLRNFADQLGRRWLKGVAAARAAFASSPPQLA